MQTETGARLCSGIIAIIRLTTCEMMNSLSIGQHSRKTLGRKICRTDFIHFTGLPMFVKHITPVLRYSKLDKK